MGGVARRATVIQRERQGADNVLVVDAGNALLNDRDPARKTKGQTSIAALNRMGYSAIALGLLDLTLLTPDELQQRMAEASFPIISANAYITGTQELAAQPYTALTVAGHRVGIMGLTERGETASFRVTDPLAAARQWLPELRREADIIVILSRAGFQADREIAEKLTGIAAIISGNAEGPGQPFIARRTGTVIYPGETPTTDSSGGLFAEGSSISAGERVGVAQLALDQNGRLVGQAWHWTRLSSDIGDDPAMAEWVSSLGAE